MTGVSTLRMKSFLLRIVAVRTFVRARQHYLPAIAITLAVGEAVGNVIKHAYQGRTDQTFSLACRTRGGYLEIEIRDSGCPFDPNGAPDLPPDELRPGGRGLYLIKTIMDEIEYGRDGGENVVSMRKRLVASTAL